MGTAYPLTIAAKVRDPHVYLPSTAVVYLLTPPLVDHRWETGLDEPDRIEVSYVIAYPDPVGRVTLFEANADGFLESWEPLPGSVEGTTDIDSALWAAGYDVDRRLTR